MNFPSDARELITGLLTLEPTRRFGQFGPGGVATIKNHAFFHGVNWESLSASKSPFVPVVSTPDDTTYFNGKAVCLWSNSDVC